MMGLCGKTLGWLIGVESITSLTLRKCSGSSVLHMQGTGFRQQPVIFKEGLKPQVRRSPSQCFDFSLVRY